MSKAIRRMPQISPADDSDGEEGDDTIDPDEPVIAGEGIGEDAKVAPPTDMQTVPGYPNVKFDASLLPPPPSNVPKSSEYKQPEFTKVPVISEETARTALIDYVDDQFCWGKGTAEKLQFTNLQSSTSYHYILETYTETRATKYENVPFKGQPIDGPQNGIPPGPWDIITNPCDLFSDEIRKMEVPHTASVKPCHRCNASGFLICSSCNGRGRAAQLKDELIEANIQLQKNKSVISETSIFLKSAQEEIRTPTCKLVDIQNFPDSSEQLKECL
ncbi:unnamed protein product [Mytilus coruscus]|uniref:Uncharacterized protein n=1 Tax=Mytilus coruscus TaxID=42192 RepID=A0A6J8AFV6_MYTCO|nr:unnamed protein product [Mytilus coruscus]